MKSLSAITVVAAAGLALSCGSSGVSAAKDIIYDAEFQKLQAQYGKVWADEDKQLKQRLADLQAKTGKKPNIIYFMIDNRYY